MVFGTFIPLAAMSGLVCLAAIACLSKILDREGRVQQTLHFKEWEQRQKMREIATTFGRVKPGSH